MKIYSIIVYGVSRDEVIEMVLKIPNN